MNSKQKLILFVFSLVTILMMLHPPFHIVIKSTKLNMGYAYLFDPPKRGYLKSSVDVPVLLVQLGAVMLVAATGWFLSKNDDHSESAGSRERDPNNKSFLESSSFILLRLFRAIFGLIAGWQVIGLFPAATWISNPSAITGNMVAIVVVKLITMAITALIFFGLRIYIHWLHFRWYGIQHPALIGKMTL